MRHSSIFKSRWFALLWAAGILWFAYDVAGGAQSGDTASAGVTDATGASVSNAEMEQLGAALNAL